MQPHALAPDPNVSHAASPHGADTQVELSLNRLCVEFLNALDSHDHARALGTFAPDAIVATPAGEARGIAEIEKSLRARPGTMLTRHICSNFQLLAHAGHTAKGVCYVVCFKQFSDGQPPLKTPLPIVAEYHDEYLQTGASWRIQKRRIVAIFDPDLQ
ncbi:nuclear transport factor 2 family protein [Variovorax sp. M-6]|uniref:nuclear transport factor 2 family protein n=1 Tax=Variovorax sp. M-6 TaxID=3233041 RepID=UPI003F9D7A1D